MEKDKFIKFIERIKRQWRFMEELNTLSRQYGGDYIDPPDLCGECVDLLSIIMKDEGEWISYFAWELDWGEKYEPGWVTDGEKNIRLKTFDDLYALLIDDPVYEPEVKNE